MRCRRLLAAFVVLLVAPSSRADETWHEVRSGELTLVSNAGEEHARRLLSDLLSFRGALSRAFPGATLLETSPTQIYAFRDFASLSPFLPSADERGAWASGFFRRGPAKNVIAVDASAAASSSRTLFHEYVHLVSSRLGPGLPLWFEEGLSELYATARIEDGGVLFGAPDGRHLRRLARDELIPLEVLVRARREDPVASEPLFYAQSWLLVHYYSVGGRDGGGEALARYVARVARGAEPTAAFDETPHLEDYARRPSFETLRVGLSVASREAELRTVRLSRAEVQHRWGELFLFTGRLPEARICLDEALRLEPALGALQETLGLAALEEEDFDVARVHLKAAMEVGGATPSGLTLYARAVLREYSGLFVEAIPESIAREAEEALRSSLRLKPAQSEAARLLSFVYLVRGKRLREAEALVEGALLLEPGDPSLRYLEGQLLARRGEYDLAREVLGGVIRDAREPALREAASSFLDRMNAVQRAPGH